MIRLLIADDHAIVRSGLKQILALAPDIEVVGEAIDGGDVLEKFRQHVFDVLLLDMTMPGISGIDLIERIRGQRESQPILVLSMHNEPQVAARAIKAGANGYLTKDSDPEKLLAAIRKVHAGGRFIDPEIAEQLAFEVLTPESRSLHGQLSEREYQIFQLLAEGRSVNEIAEKLSISNKTVSTHKSRLLEKMHCGSVADLVRYAVRHNLL